jgi:hypothetical protein
VWQRGKGGRHLCHKCRWQHHTRAGGHQHRWPACICSGNVLGRVRTTARGCAGGNGTLRQGRSVATRRSQERRSATPARRATHLLLHPGRPSRRPPPAGAGSCV